MAVNSTIQLSDVLSLELKKEDSGYYLVVPLAVFGSWVHSEYGQLVFNQEVYDNLITNYENNVLGYEVPLYCGHNLDLSRVGGVPAVGYMKSLNQRGDVLYGLFKCIDEEVYRQAKNGQWPYASIEYYANATNRETGEKVGYLLTGVALTPEPFLTRMPKVQAMEIWLSNVPEQRFSFMFNLSTVEKEDKMSNETKETDNIVSVMEQRLSLVISERDKAIAELNELKKQYEEQAKALASTKLAARIEKISKMNLPQAVKDYAIKNLKSGISDEEAERSIELLTIQAAEMTAMLTTSHGVQPSQPPAEVTENPFQDVIEKNKRIASSKRSAMVS